MSEVISISREIRTSVVLMSWDRKSMEISVLQTAAFKESETEESNSEMVSWRGLDFGRSGVT